MGNEFTISCSQCPETFKGSSVSTVFEEKRFHMELRHLEGEIETDT